MTIPGKLYVIVMEITQLTLAQYGGSLTKLTMTVSKLTCDKARFRSLVQHVRGCVGLCSK